MAHEDGASPKEPAIATVGDLPSGTGGTIARVRHSVFSQENDEQVEHEQDLIPLPYGKEVE